MTTLKLAILPQKISKDGSHKIRIAIGHKSQVRYLVTKYKIDALSQFKGGQVVGRPDASSINVKLRSLLNEYQERLDEIKAIELYSCAQLRDLLSKAPPNSSALAFNDVAQRYVAELIEDGRESYAMLIKRNNNYFHEFTKVRIMLADITPTIIGNYARFLRNTKGLGETSIGMMMSYTRVVINKARREQLVKYDLHPFEFYSVPASCERELDISPESFKAIRDSSPNRRGQIVARDLFCLSYYLCGINLIDLLKIDFRNIDTIEYIRTKSRNMKQGEKRISFTIPEEAKPIINRWMNKKSGTLDFRYKFSYHNFSCFINRGIASLAKDLNIKSKVTYYSARKSFVQHGFDLGISLEILEYCIGQSMKSNRPIFNYLKIMRRHADVAVRKILDNLKEKPAEVLQD